MDPNPWDVDITQVLYTSGLGRNDPTPTTYNNLLTAMKSSKNYKCVWEGKNMEIGGDTCHLCGAYKETVKTKAFYGKKYRKSGVAKRFIGITEYKCGTKVLKERKNTIEDTTVTVGKRCIK